jgi:hypothetical protein
LENVILKNNADITQQNVENDEKRIVETSDNDNVKSSLSNARENICLYPTISPTPLKLRNIFQDACSFFTTSNVQALGNSILGVSSSCCT